MLYVVQSERMRKLLNEVINKVGGTNNFAKLLNVKKITVRQWENGTAAIPIKVIKVISEKLNQDLWELLEEEKLRSLIYNKKSLTIRKKISTMEAYILGWILTDGHLDNYGASISEHKEVLEKLKEVISKTYELNPGCLTIVPDKNTFKLKIESAAFSQYLNFRFGVPIGCKARLIKIPTQIIESSQEVKLSFLAGLLEGDGSVSYYVRKFKNGQIFKAPRITFNTFSKEMGDQIKALLIELSYHPKDYHDSRGENKVNIFKLSECCKFFFEVYPYLTHPTVIQNFSELLSQSVVIDSVLIDGKEVVKIGHQKFGNYKLLADYISKNGYMISASSVKNWCLGFFRPPLSVVTKLCGYFDLNFFNFIPEWLSGVLWLHKKITKEEFERLRFK